MKHDTIILVGVLLLMSCDESDIIREPESKPLYPTTIEKLDADELAKLRYEYHHKNYWIFTSLNQFGFSDCCDDLGPVSGESPPAVLNSITEAEAIQMVESFLIKNQKYTGISATDRLAYDYKYCDIINSNISWSLVVANQKLDSLEVIDSRIVVHLDNGKVTWCVGNWYTEAYIPDSFKYNSEEAKLLLLNTTIYSGESQSNVTITEENLSESDARLIIFPVETNEKIELRVAWEIYLPYPLFYLIYLDVMTGEILRKECTVIYD